MSSKKNDFDLMDFWQKHNRNVALDRSAKAAEDAARAKKEQARQAKLDREANDRHRAQMKEMAKAEKEANDRHRAKMEEMAKAEKEAKEFSKQQQFKLYDLSCQFEELEKQETVIAKIQLFYEINAEFEKIAHDAIVDLQYRKLYTQVETNLKKEYNALSRDHNREWTFFKEYNKLKQQVELIKGRGIRTFEEMHQAETLLNEVQNKCIEIPELTATYKKNALVIQNTIDKYHVSIANLKWFWDNFSLGDKSRQDSKLQFLLLSFYEIDEKTMQCKEWEDVVPDVPFEEDFKNFCYFCLEYIQNTSDYTETVLRLMEGIDSPEAEQMIELIKEEKLRKIKERKEQKTLQSQQKSKSNTGCGCLIFIILAFIILWVIANMKR